MSFFVASNGFYKPIMAAPRHTRPDAPCPSSPLSAKPPPNSTGGSARELRAVGAAGAASMEIR